MKNKTSFEHFKEADRLAYIKSLQDAKKLSPQDLQNLLKSKLPQDYDLAKFKLPDVVDLSNYVFFIRSQNNWGGCVAMALAYILDTLKEQERPYSPNCSYRFMEYVLDVGINYRDIDPVPIIPPGITIPDGIGQEQIPQQFGCCTEGSLPTNYDPLDMPQPLEKHYQEASLYRIEMVSDWANKLTVEGMKTLLFLFGPLAASGTIGGTEHHRFTIVGYNEKKKTFKMVNSAGDQWHDGGMWDIPYDVLKKGNVPRIDSVYYVVNKPTPLFAHQFTMRLKIRHKEQRNYLSVIIGVKGQPPLVVWDCPNQKSRRMLDTSKNLFITVPLPKYANQFWPPNEKNKWYAQVCDNTTGSGTAAYVDEVLFVQRIVTAKGECFPFLFPANTQNLQVQRGSSVQIPVSAKTYLFYLDSVVSFGQTTGLWITFDGSLSLQTQPPKSKPPQPLANKEIKIYKVQVDTIGGVILEDLVGIVKTNNAGKYSLRFRHPRMTKIDTEDFQAVEHYQAITLNPDGTVLAVSTIATVGK